MEISNENNDQQSQRQEGLMQPVVKNRAEEIENAHDGHIGYYLNQLINGDDRPSEKLHCYPIEINQDLKAARAQKLVLYE